MKNMASDLQRERENIQRQGDKVSKHKSKCLDTLGVAVGVGTEVPLKLKMIWSLDSEAVYNILKRILLGLR